MSSVKLTLCVFKNLKRLVVIPWNSGHVDNALVHSGNQFVGLASVVTPRIARSPALGNHLLHFAKLVHSTLVSTALEGFLVQGNKPIYFVGFDEVIEPNNPRPRRGAEGCGAEFREIRHDPLEHLVQIPRLPRRVWVHFEILTGTADLWILELTLVAALWAVDNHPSRSNIAFSLLCILGAIFGESVHALHLFRRLLYHSRREFILLLVGVNGDWIR
mmetsp:Transcript_9253/g.22740  ORF Transcript_9253/g.22740 Transcript_9253/m.22740 type:complete len:217 (+) Transcript_9253:536-1186(+)